MQKSILSHAYAVAYVNMTQDELHHLSSCHLESLSMKHASCLVTNFASAPLFEIAADDFAFCLRARMHLPCRIAPFFEMPAHHLLLQRGSCKYAVYLGVRAPNRRRLGLRPRGGGTAPTVKIAIPGQ